MAGVGKKLVAEARRIIRLRERSFLSQMRLEVLELRSWTKAWVTPLWEKPNYLPAFALG